MVPFLSELVSLLIDTSYSWIRMLIALVIAIALSLVIGISMARSRILERIMLPIIDVLQTLPILAFFPFVIYVVIIFLPGLVGINGAVIFLIITSMLWNMIFGVYEAVKTIPNEFVELGSLNNLNLYQRLRTIFIPASLPRLSEQMNLSWAIGLFYLVTSEIFSTGSQQYQVQGIGVDLAQLGFSGNLAYYLLGILIFVGFVIITRLTLFAYFDKIANKSSFSAFERKRKRVEINFGSIIYKVKTFSNIEEFYHKYIIRLRRQKNKLLSFAFVLPLLLVLLLVLDYVVPNIQVTQLMAVPQYELSALTSLLASFLRIWGAFVAVLLVGIPISVYVVFLSKRKSTYLLIFQVLASIPATVLLPLIVSSLANNGEAVAFVVFFLSGLWYVIFSIIGSTSGSQAQINEVKQIFRLKGWKAWNKIYLRAIAPGLVTGAITAIAAEWNASIVAEHFSASGISGTAVTSVNIGMGKLLDTSLSSGNLYLMVIALINMTAMIILFNTFVWKRFYRRITEVYV